MAPTVALTRDSKVRANISQGKYYPKKCHPKKLNQTKPKIKVLLVIVGLPHFLGPKVSFIPPPPCRPLFFARSVFSWMCLLFPLLWWMRTGRDLVCQPPGTIGVMSASKQLLTGQGNMALLGDVKGVIRGSTSWGTTQSMGG